MRTSMRNSELGIWNINRYHGTRRWLNLVVLFTFGFLYLFTFSQTVYPDTPKPTIVADKSLPNVTVIPNPARGKKLNFRVMAAGPCKVRIRVNNRFFDVVATIEKEGSALFDILWSLKTVPEGIYYYQAQIEDKATGQITKLPLQKFVVLK